MTGIKIVAETKDTVTVRRTDLASLLEALEDAEDRAAVHSRRAQEAIVGKQAMRQSYLTGNEVRRLLDGENPVRVWREKRGLTQRALAAKAGIAPSYLADIENGRKPGSADALSRLAGALEVLMEDLMDEQRRKHMPGYGPVYLRTYPSSAGIAPGHRGAAPQERPFASLDEARNAVRDEWLALKNQSPAIVDEQRLPILGQEDLWREMEPDLFQRQPTIPAVDVAFEEDAQWRGKLASYVMWATIAGEPVRCRVTDDVFRDCLDESGVGLKDFPRLFRRHRQAFERAFLRAIHDRRLSPWDDNGTLRQEVVLTCRDFYLLASSSG